MEIRKLNENTCKFAIQYTGIYGLHVMDKKGNALTVYTQFTKTMIFGKKQYLILSRMAVG